MNKYAIAGVLNNPAKTKNSHSAGYIRHFGNKLFAGEPYDIITEEHDWTKYGYVAIHHGPNFKPGMFNVVGGIGEKLIKRYNRFIEACNSLTRVVVFDGFNLEDLYEKRLKKYMEKTNTSIQAPDCKYIIGPENYLEKREHDIIYVGDSHIFSIASAESDLIYRPGKTLYGFLKNPYSIYQPEFLTEKVTFYFGNIDVRFHLPRQKDPIKATEDLVRHYYDYTREFGDVKVCSLLPIEPESRKIPGSGKYQGQGFYGSQQLREDIVDVFNGELVYYFGSENVLTWPTEWYENPEWYMKNVMEPRQSVHVRPRYYKHYKNLF